MALDGSEDSIQGKVCRCIEVVPLAAVFEALGDGDWNLPLDGRCQDGLAVLVCELVIVILRDEADAFHLPFAYGLVQVSLPAGVFGIDGSQWNETTSIQSSIHVN